MGYILNVRDENGNFRGIRTIKGDPGSDGQNGTTPHIDSNGNWWIGETDTGIKARGDDGEDGNDGAGVSVVSISESAADGGSNVMRFSDGSTLNVRNGSTGGTGAAGASVRLFTTAYSYTTAQIEQTAASDVGAYNVNESISDVVYGDVCLFRVLDTIKGMDAYIVGMATGTIHETNTVMFNVNGAIQPGAKGDNGDKGDDGGSPSIELVDTSTGVNIFISNPDGSEFAAVVNDGESAYNAAVQGGYTGSTADFYEDLGAIGGLASMLASI